MVLQRDMPVPIWGTASPNEIVAVKFRDQLKLTKANKEGKWQVRLDPLKAGGPDLLLVNHIAIDDVLVGEVWVGSGQSNMHLRVAKFIDRDPVLAQLLADSPYSRIRLATVHGNWQEATEVNVRKASALLVSFGVRLHQNLDVPIGLVLGAMDGTPSGYWLSERAFSEDRACQKAISRAATWYDAERKEHMAALALWWIRAQIAKFNKKLAPRMPDAPLKPGECRRKIGHLYESRIRRIIPFAIRGVLWDQGEGAVGIRGLDQVTATSALIRSWRNDWGQGDFPFLFVQKPSGGACAWDPANPTTSQASKFSALPEYVPHTIDGIYAESHYRICNNSNTGMVQSRDLGAGWHPINKSGYGKRASLLALGMVYGKNIEYYGPVYSSLKFEGENAIVEFKHTGQGLAFKHGHKLQGFAIAGRDRQFHWADAVIDGESVIVSSPLVKMPVAVRYAWGGLDISWANLFNKDGLPAQTFRTDDWNDGLGDNPLGW
jgi:sialate O-acetylesterase